MSGTDRDPTVQTGAGLLRGVAAIVATGIFLGLGFNYLARQAGPRSGLPWIAEERKLDSLEDHQPQAADFRAVVAGISTAASESAPAAPPSEPRPGGADGHAAKPSSGADADRAAGEEVPLPRAKSASSPSKPAVAPPPAALLVPADMTDPMGIAKAPEGSDLPVIPDLGRPLQMQLPAVKKFFDAEAALIVDARDPGEFAEGHIPGAVNMPFDQVITDPERIEALDPRGKAIIVYCGGGTCEVSMNLAYRMVEQGKKKVLVFMGGWPEWQAAGYPVAKGDS